MPPPAITIGIDLGTNCGWASLASDGSRIGSGTWRLGKGRARLAELRRAATALIEEAIFVSRDVLVCYEDIQYSPYLIAALSYGGYRAVLELVTLDLDVVCKSINVSTWKKDATGSGGAGKPRYTAAASERFALDLNVKDNEDEAAALGVAYACLLKRGGPYMPVKGQQMEMP